MATELILPSSVRSVDTTKRRGRVAPMAQSPRQRRSLATRSDREVVTGDPMGELGTTGLRQYGGFVLEEWLPRLRGRYGAWAYREMMDNSPIAGGIIFAIKMLARQVEWRVEDDVELPRAGMDCGFVESCMHDMSHTWGDVISEVLSMVGYGWAFHETVYKRRQGGDPLPEMDYLEEYGDQRSEDTDEVPASSKYDDGRVGWRRLPVRAQETLMRWHFRGYSGIRAMEQIDWHGGKHVIPIQKALLFRTETTRNNPEGRSLLRNAWTSYYALQNIQGIEAIGIERDLAGIPVAAPPPGVDLYSPENDELRERVQDLVQTIRRDEDEGVVLPTSEWMLELLTTGGSRQIDTDQVIRRYENRMTTSVLADFLMIGQDSVGSYAMVDVKSELFGVALDAILSIVCEVFNRYAVPRLLALNGMKPTKMPRILCSSAGRIDLRLVGEFLVNMSLAGAPIPWSEKGMEHLWRAGGLPQPEWDNLMVPAQPSPAAHDSQWRPAWGSEDGPTQQPEPKKPGEGADTPTPPAKPKERDHIAKADEKAGAMVALYPDPALARRLALTGGEDPDDIHLTLALLDSRDNGRLADVLRGFAASTPPMDGRISGAGRFELSHKGTPVVYASPDVPTLPKVRERLIETLEAAGFPPSTAYGFTPHMTLSYADNDVPQFPGHPLAFTALSLVVDGQRQDFPLSPDAVVKAAGDETLDMSGPLAVRSEVLSRQLEREMEGHLRDLGQRAADGYARVADHSGTPDRAAGAAMGHADIGRWVNERLKPALRNHAQRVARDISRTVGTHLGVQAQMSHTALNRVTAATGRHLKIRDLEPQVREAVKASIVEGREAGDTPVQVAERIRANVPAGRFRVAGAAWRAGLIARAETGAAVRAASLEAYDSTGRVHDVEAHVREGSSDEQVHRNGEVLPLEEAREAAVRLHPDSTASYSPVVRGGQAALRS